jgi:hypothetical protein
VVVLSLPGVQTFIAESRTTSDLVSASTLIAALASCAAAVVEEGEGEIVIPARPATIPATAAEGTETNVPNRILALAEAGTGAAIARKAAEAVRRQWRAWVMDLFPSDHSSDTPGCPDVQWVCVGPEAGDYHQQFTIAQAALAARRRIRTFTPMLGQGQRLCSVSARWPAAIPPRQNKSRLASRRHERQEVLSVPCWVKRIAPHCGQRPSAPSTASISSAPYRAAIVAVTRTNANVREALLRLYGAGKDITRPETPISGLPVPKENDEVSQAVAWLSREGGPWVFADRWCARSVSEARAERSGSDGRQQPVDPNGQDERLARQGRDATRELAIAIGREPGTHFAVIVQDLDDMGLFLGAGIGDAAGNKPVTPSSERHREVSQRLQGLASDQLTALTDAGGAVSPLFAVPVYAGGDDLLVLASAATALRVAQKAHDLVPDTLRTTSTGVFFAHHQSGLQSAVASAVALLHEAKSRPGKHTLGMGFERRSGARFSTVTPWQSIAEGRGVGSLIEALIRGTAGLLETNDGGHLGRPAARVLSPRIVFDLQRDQEALASLLSREGHHYEVLKAELTRLVARHSGRRRPVETDRDLAHVLLAAGRDEASCPGSRTTFDPVPAARLAVFLRQEAR